MSKAEDWQPIEMVVHPLEAQSREDEALQSEVLAKDAARRGNAMRADHLAAEARRLRERAESVPR
jgi:hypothetical protein